MTVLRELGTREEKGMGRFMEVAVGITLIFVSIGAMTHVTKTGDWWVLVAILIFVTSMYKVRVRHAQSELFRLPTDQGKSKHLEALEKRMNDLQDIVLGLDDKLERLAKKANPPPPTADEERTP